MAELVSILIPAYNERFFGEALASALAQRYDDYEIVVCDDSPGGFIERCVKDAASPRVRYRRNPERLGFAGNFLQCFHEARGDLVKFLNDDDRLRPECVESLAGVLGANPSASLATSRRCIIDADGRERPDTPSTAPVSHVSAFMLGRELGDFVLANSLNLIGEPTTVMFRRSRLAIEDAALFRWGGVDYHCLADLSLWLRLLSTGLAFYHAAALSEFRMHEGQEQRGEAIRLDCLDEWLALVRQARSAGFLSTPALWRQALTSLRARILFGGPPQAYEPVTRARLEGLVRAVDTELRSAGA